MEPPETRKACQRPKILIEYIYIYIYVYRTVETELQTAEILVAESQFVKWSAFPSVHRFDKIFCKPENRHKHWILTMKQYFNVFCIEFRFPMIACFVWFFSRPNLAWRHNLTRIPNLNPRKSWGEARLMETGDPGELDRIRGTWSHCVMAQPRQRFLCGCKTCDGTDRWSQSTSLHFSALLCFKLTFKLLLHWVMLKSHEVTMCLLFRQVIDIPWAFHGLVVGLGSLTQTFRKFPVSSARAQAQHGVCQLVDFLLLPTAPRWELGKFQKQ